MPLEVGTRLAAYEIVAPLGAGGMGEVYRARDTKLTREVAIKILPDLFVADTERIARFQREAQLLAALNHPHIAAIYGFEQSGATQFLVLELVEGESLAARLTRGALPVAESLTIARQIIDALETAHDKGIVHRDLKPANIMVSDDGKVKILDFGLAKMTDPVQEASAAASQDPRLRASFSPTITLGATQPGMILGTAAYMSPEQSKGRTADKRSDVWAFGCVLYEMLTGRRAFEGEDVSDTLAAILRAEPDWSAIPAAVPSHITTLVKRCLEKDRAKRIPDIAVARYLMDDGAAAKPPAAAPARRSGRTWPAWTAAALLLLTTIALGTWIIATRVPADLRLLRFNVALPEGWNLTVSPAQSGVGGGSPAPLSISPDGTRLVFVANSSTGRSRLWIRGLDTLVAQELPETDGAAMPFWSPDSHSLAFFADGKLRKIAVAGGPPTTLCDVTTPRGGTWSRDNVVVFAPSNRSGLMKVSASGGVPSTAIALANGESGYARPWFLPDGRHLIYGVYGGGIYVGTLDSPDRTKIFDKFDAMNVLYAQGHVLFIREHTLMAQPFDANRLILSGEPVPVASQVQLSGSPSLGVFSVSENGVLAYQSGSGSSGSQLVWLDRTGKASPPIGDPGEFSDVSLSPDGKRAVVTLPEQSHDLHDIWVVDLARGLRTRLTFDGTDDLAGLWSPDGTQVAYSSKRTPKTPSEKTHYDLYVKASNGVGNESLLFADENDKNPLSWSSDGKLLLYVTLGSADLWVLPVADDRKPVAFLKTPFNEVPGQFSPDHRWVAYVSNESGLPQLFVVPSTGSGGKWMVSGSGVPQVPRWTADGKEIVYFSQAQSTMMSASVNGNGPNFEVGTVQKLFQVFPRGSRYFFDVARDGRILLNTSLVDPTSKEPISVVVNWPAGLKQ